MKKRNILWVFYTLFLAFIFSGAVNVEAKTDLISLGTGKYQITVTDETTIDDISKVLGDPKLKTKSAFGGYAYSFYTDSNYSNYLYIETTSEDKIISYGSVDPTYKAKSESYGDKYNYYPRTWLAGFSLNNNGIVKGGIYYNTSALYNGSSSKIIEFYKANYQNDLETYNKTMASHGVIMFNAYSAALGGKSRLIYDEEVFDIAISYMKQGTSLRQALLQYSDQLDLSQRRFINTSSNITIENTYYVFNPLMYGRYAANYKSTDFGSANIAVFDYNPNTGTAYSLTIAPSVKDMLLDDSIANLGISKEDIIINQNIMYVLSLLDDKMTEREKAFIIASYTHEGNIYRFTDNKDTYKGLFLDHGAVCGGFADTFNMLAERAGLTCREVTSNKANHAWNVCNIDGEWTYLDTTKSGLYRKNDVNNYYETYSPTLFFDKTSFDAYSTLYEFSDAKTRPTTFFNNDFPEGADLRYQGYPSYISHVYYDDNYKYYMGLSNINGIWISAIYQENRTTGLRKELIKFNDSYNDYGIAKVDDMIYYIDDAKTALYSYNLKTQAKTKELTFASNQKVGGVFIRDGYVYYNYYDTEAEEEMFAAYTPITTWAKQGIYTPTNQDSDYKLLYLESPDEVTIVKALANKSAFPKGKLEIPETINGKKVVAIADDAFNSLFNDVGFSGEVIIPKYIKYIGNGAFSSNPNITKVTFNEGIKYIGNGAFSDIGITGTLVLPNSLEVLEQYAFEGCPNIEKVIIKGNLQAISYGAFSSNPNLTNVEIEEGVEYISQYAFNKCEKLNNVFLPSSIKEIGSKAFSNTDSLENLIIYSKNVEYMEHDNKNTTIYLYGDSKTANYADKNSIPYQDLNNIKKEVKFTTHEYNIKVGDPNITLDYQITPSFYQEGVTFTSSNKNIATVDENGVVTLGKYSGTTIITIKTASGLKDTCTINVSGNPITSILLNKSTIKSERGKSIQLEALISPITTTDDTTLTWESSNPTVATVDSNGKVTTKTNGEADITVSTASGKKNTCHVIVSDQYLLDATRYFGGRFIELYIDYAITNSGNEVLADWVSNREDIITGGQIISPAEPRKGGFAILTYTDSVYKSAKTIAYSATPVTLSNGNKQYIGDLNNNGEFDMEDIYLIEDIIVSNDMSEDNLLVAELNGDGIINQSDMQMLYEIVKEDSINFKENIGIKLYVDSDIIDVTDSILLSVRATSEITTDTENITYTSSDPSIADIEESLFGYKILKPKKAGNITLTATNSEGKKDSLDIEIIDSPIYISEAEIVIEKGQSGSIDVWMDNKLKSASYWLESNNDLIASPKQSNYGYSGSTKVSAEIEGNDVGTTIITISVGNNKSVDCIVNVVSDIEEAKNINSITLDKTNISLEKDASENLNVSFDPIDTTDNKTITWESSNNDIVSVDENGKVTALDYGTAIITATTINGKTATCTVTVNERPITNITLDKKGLTLEVGAKAKLTPTITPLDTTDDKILFWESSNIRVVSVDQSGNIEALNSGKATITVQTANGQTATCTITVKKPIIKESGWEEIDGKYYYYDSTIGDYVSGWKDIEGLRYYFDLETKERYQGIHNVEGKNYFFGVTKGNLMYGLINYNGDTYYSDPKTGELKTGVTIIKGKPYFFGVSKFKLQKGFIGYNGDYYYSDSKGILQKGMHEINGNYYYFAKDNNYKAVSGWKEIDDLKYYFDPVTKIRYQGIHNVEGKNYFFGITKGKLMYGFIGYEGDTYYSDPESGELKTGVTIINEKPYFFGISKFKLQKGFIGYNGDYYYSDSEGILQTGMHEINGNYYYFAKDSNYKALSGWQDIEGLRYYFDPVTKIRYQGIHNVEGKNYFFGVTKGKLMYGFIGYEGDTYYSDPETGELKTGVTIINEKPYFFGISKFKLQKGFIGYNGDYYYSDSEGILQTGMHEINGNYYYFDKDSNYKALSGWQDIEGLRYYFDPVTKIRYQGIHNVEGKNYFFGVTKGKVMYGFINYNGDTYYTDPTTGELATGVTIINNDPYFFGITKFKLQKGLIGYNGDYYYSNSEGILQTGPITINGINYYFDETTYKNIW